MSIRPDDWPERLAAFLESRGPEPFVWGSNDCALFAADWVLTLTGADPLGPLRGAWTDEASARDLMASLGGLDAAARSVLGEPLPTVLLARRGDVMLTPTDTGSWHLCICCGDHWRGAGGSWGAVHSAACAWAIGWELAA